MNAPPFPINPEVGEWSGNWVWNGARWVASPTTGLRVVARLFTASGPYMPTPGLVSCSVECIGAGGGGGGAGSSDAQNTRGGGGGGSGGYSRSTLPAALVRGGVLVTVAPTTGGESGGGTTSFGALVIAYGGGGGAANDGLTYATSGSGGPGASVGIGDIALPGNAGQNGASNYVPVGVNWDAASGGQGGAIAGGVAPAPIAGAQLSVAGADGAPNTGAGGSGACVNQVAGGVPGGVGGQGGSGVCIVTEYCWGDRDQPASQWRPPLDVNVNVRPPRPWPHPPWPGGGPWPPGAWWPPPEWGVWPPGWNPKPREAIEGREFEAGQPYDQSINPETGLPWEDEP